MSDSSATQRSWLGIALVVGSAVAWSYGGAIQRFIGVADGWTIVFWRCLFAGLFLHSAAAIILIVPIVMPLVLAVGIDPVHFGLIVTLNMGIGQQTPPVASVLMTACSIAKADMWKVTRVNLPFIGVLVALLLMVTYIPAIPMFLVEYFYR